MDLLEATPAFVRYSELGGSTFRDTDLLALVSALLFVHCRKVVLISESV